MEKRETKISTLRAVQCVPISPVEESYLSNEFKKFSVKLDIHLEGQRGIPNFRGLISGGAGALEIYFIDVIPEPKYIVLPIELAMFEGLGVMGQMRSAFIAERHSEDVAPCGFLGGALSVSVGGGVKHLTLPDSFRAKLPAKPKPKPVLPSAADYPFLLRDRWNVN